MTLNTIDYDWNSYVRKWERWAVEPSGRGPGHIQMDLDQLYSRARIEAPRWTICEDVDHFVYEAWEMHSSRPPGRSVVPGLKRSATAAGVLAAAKGKKRKNNALKSLIEASVQSQIIGSARSSIEYRVINLVWHSLADLIFNLLESVFRDYGIRDSGGHLAESRFGAYFNAGNIAFVDFFLCESLIDSGVLGEQFYRSSESLRDICFTSLTREQAVVLTKPRVYRDDRKRFHREDGMAVEWKEGGYYFLQGVRFEEGLFKRLTGRKLSFKQAMGITDMRQRWIALKFLDPNEFLNGSGAVLLDRSEKGNELYVVERLFPSHGEAYFLCYGCPSTGKRYVKGVHPNIGITKNADMAQAWSFRVSYDEYLGLDAEA